MHLKPLSIVLKLKVEVDPAGKWGRTGLEGSKSWFSGTRTRLVL